MANANMRVSVLVDLVDRLTAPLRNMTRGVTGIANSVGNMTRGIAGMTTSVGDLGRRIGIIGAAFAGLSFMAPIQQAAAWDTQLRDIAITAGKTGGAAETMIGDLSKQYRQLAFMTGQTSDDIAKGAKTLISGNMATELIEKLMPTIAKVATATGATMTDTAKTVLSLSDTLKIPSEQMEAMLGKLAVAGKLGRFEFVDMARALPELTAQMAKLGITGREAVESLGANLQIAMIGTADPSQAATNLNNFLTKINAPEAIKKFEKELKVDVTGVMTDATAKGINPIEAVIEKLIGKLKPQQAEIDKIMKQAGVSDKQREEQIKTLISGTNVGKIYADMQVLGFLLPMMQNIAKFKEFREQLKTAGVGTIVDDFATRMKGLQPQLNQFGVLASAVGDRIGLAFASNLPTAMTAIQNLLKGVDHVDKKLPGFVDGALSWGGALLVLGAGLAILTPVVSALAGLFGLLISPVVLAAAAIGAAAYHIWKNWETLGPEMGKIFGGLKQAAGGFGEMMAGIFTADGERTIGGARQMMAGLGTALDGGWEVLRSLARAGVSAVDGAIGGLASSIDKVFGTDLAGSYARLKSTAADTWDGMKAKGNELITWAQELPARITAALGDAWSGAKQGAIDAWEAIKAKGNELITWAQELPARISGALGNLAGDLMKAGSAAIQGLWDGMKAKFDALLAWAGEKIAALKSLFSFSLTGPTINMPAPGTTPMPQTDPLGNPIGGFNPTSAPAAPPALNVPKVTPASLGLPAPDASRPIATVVTPEIKLPRVETASSNLDTVGKMYRDLRGPSAPAEARGNPVAQALPGSGIGGQAGFTRTAGGPAANSNVTVGGRIVVEAAEGTRVVNVQSENPAVPVTPNRGTMLGRA